MRTLQAVVTEVETIPVGGRLCECGRVAAFVVTVGQLSAEQRLRAERLLLCGVCYRLWCEVEGPARESHDSSRIAGIAGAP